MSTDRPLKSTAPVVERERRRREEQERLAAETARRQAEDDAAIIAATSNTLGTALACAETVSSFAGGDASGDF